MAAQNAEYFEKRVRCGAVRGRDGRLMRLQKHSVGDRVVSGLVDAVRSLTHYHRFAQIYAGLLLVSCLPVCQSSCPRSTRSSDDDRSGGSEDDADTCVAVPARVSDVDPPVTPSLSARAQDQARAPRSAVLARRAAAGFVCAVFLFCAPRDRVAVPTRRAYPPILTLVCWLRRRQVRRSG